MDVGWNYRREHLRLSQRSHNIITNGGDQPNVVPRNAATWYDFRETDYESIMNMWDIGNKVAQGAAADDQHEVDVARARLCLAASHQPERIAQAMQGNIERPARMERGGYHAGEGAHSASWACPKWVSSPVSAIFVDAS